MTATTTVTLDFSGSKGGRSCARSEGLSAESSPIASSLTFALGSSSCVVVGEEPVPGLVINFRLNPN